MMENCGVEEVEEGVQVILAATWRGSQGVAAGHSNRSVIGGIGSESVQVLLVSMQVIPGLRVSLHASAECCCCCICICMQNMPEGSKGKKSGSVRTYEGSCAFFVAQRSHGQGY